MDISRAYSASSSPEKSANRLAIDYGQSENGTSAMHQFPHGCSKRYRSHDSRTSVHNSVGSVDAEFLLQTRRRCRVLEHEPLLRIDVAMRLLRHQRTFMEAAQDQLQLAWIGVDIADREYPGNIGLERGR